MSQPERCYQRGRSTRQTSRTRRRQTAVARDIVPGHDFITQGGWILQVGSFTQQADALSLRDRLKKSDYQVSVKDVKAREERVHRVLIGPVSDRPSAEKLRNKLASEQKLTAMALENK